MKKMFCTFFVSFLCLIATAQKITKDSLINVISEEVCTEMSKPSVKIKKENLEQQLGLMLMPSILKHLDDIQRIYKIEEINESNMYEVGRDVGMRLGVKCESFLKILTDNFDDIQELSNSKKKKGLSVSGSFIKLTTAEISYFEVKTSTGKTEKFFWMGYFDGADELSSRLTTISNKKVRVEFEEKEIYKPSLKEYVKVKVATKFELL